MFSNTEFVLRQISITLESSQVANDVIAFDSPSSASGNPFNMWSPFSPQISHYYSSDNTTNGLPLGVYSSSAMVALNWKWKKLSIHW